MEINNYETSDLALATYLSLEGFGIIDITGEANRRSFVFQRKQGKKIEDKVIEFYSKKARVDALDYFNEMRNLKNRLYR